ncbi:MAG: helicase/exodeoxyribonuclease subunit [Chthonomonadales bacterium]|nr:helicase/exodeoxyribonuclease subunit [Chthonomonadales bacterium]
MFFLPSVCYNAPPIARKGALFVFMNTLQPPLTLILGPAGSGKTHWAVERFQAHAGRALLVVSSSEQAVTCARRIANGSAQTEAEVRGSILHLHGLTTALLSARRDDGYRVIRRLLQRLALTELFQTHIRPDDFLGRMHAAPGFIPALVERLREWKLACLTPDMLEQAAEAVAAQQDDPPFQAKTRELVRLFRAYEDFLAQNRLRDEEDCLRLATECAADTARPLFRELDTVIVDGFFRFNRAQRRLLAALAGRGLEEGMPEISVAVTLPFEPDRSLLFAAPERTVTLLRAEFMTLETALPPRSDTRAPLLHLERHLFAPEPPATKLAKFSAPPLLLFDAPNPYVEAEMVAREFRRLHAGPGGYVWDDFAVILRGMGDYAPILAAVFERYGIPLGVDGPELLSDNPLLRTVLHLLAIVRRDWQRDDLLAFLKSSYTAPTPLEADALRRRARAAGVRHGREKWLELAAGAEGTVARTLEQIAHFDTLLRAGEADPQEFIERLREIVTEFGLEARIEAGEPTRAQRDRAALKEAWEVLAALAQMDSFAGRHKLAFSAFHEALLAAWNSASALAYAEGDRVRVAEPYDARERPLKVAAVMGLTERVFPRRITEDPFFRDDERAALRRAGEVDLEPHKNRADDERFLFYLAVTAPADRLILSYPRSADESDTLPSFFLDEVRAVFQPTGSALPHAVSRTLADVAPRFEEAVTPADRLRTACAELFDPGSDTLPRLKERRHRAAHLLQDGLKAAEGELFRQDLQELQDLQEDAKALASGMPSALNPVAAVLASRHLPSLPRLNDPELRERFAGVDRIFSIAELEAYRRCPLQYFFRYHLRLRPEEDGANARVQENLLRHVLRRYHRRRPADADARRPHMQQLLTQTLDRASLDTGPHRLRLMQRLISDALDAHIDREERFTPLFGMASTHNHLTFGSPSAGEDAASTPDPLQLTDVDGTPVLVSGSLDRVDLDPTGQRALMMTYRLDSAPEFAVIQRGASLQLPLGLLALEQLFGYHAAAACYDAAPQSGRPRLFRTEHVNLRAFSPVLPHDNGRTVTPLNRQQYTEIVETAATAARNAARGIRNARIEATPGDHCLHCHYTDVCRTTRLGLHDGELAPPPTLPAP